MNTIKSNLISLIILISSIFVKNFSMEFSENISCINTLFGHSTIVTCLLNLEDGRFISGCWDGIIMIWDSETGKIVKELKDEECDKAHHGPVRGLLNLGSGNFVSGFQNGEIKICNIHF